jgi:broad specificity phosphatase PhoE
VTRFLVVRHAHHALVGKALAGRSDNVGLDASGIAQADALARRLASSGIAAIYTSPQRRARETAAPLAAKPDVPLRVDAGLDEIDFGSWTGKSFEELAEDAQWAVWCEHRSVAQPPGGERFAEVQRRVVDALQRLHRVHPRDTVALVSHGDVIKAGIAHVLEMSLDDVERLEIAPASVSVVLMENRWSRVDLLNDCGGV